MKPEFGISYTVSDPEAVKERASVLTSAADVTLKEIQSIDYSWGEIDFEVRPMGRALMDDADCCMDSALDAGGDYDLDVEPDDINVSDTVTVIWEIA